MDAGPARRALGEPRIAVGGAARDASRLPALVAEDGGATAGLVTYHCGVSGVEITATEPFTVTKADGEIWPGQVLEQPLT